MNRNPSLGRRDLLRRSGLLGLGAAAWGVDTWNPARAAALAEVERRAAVVDGTTLASTIELPPGTGYRRLRVGPGWPTILRTDLATTTDRRLDRRRAVAALAVLTDVHLVDAQSPGRVEFLDRFGDPFSGAFRPQETLTTQVLASMVERVNQVGKGPITGRPLDVAVSTGDNIDNQQHNELDWFLTGLNGGTITPTSGGATYRGVQSPDWGDDAYWCPDRPATAAYGRIGFPQVDGLLDAAVAPHRSAGLAMAWYSCYGNHDGLLQGNLPRSEAADRILTGDRKIARLPDGTGAGFVARMFDDLEGIEADLASGRLPSHEVTPDAHRRTVRRDEWLRAHLDHPGRVGPHGHGFTESHVEDPMLAYRFDVAPGVVGLTLDTGGYSAGSIGQRQLDWLEEQLRSTHSSAFDASGQRVRTGGTDTLVLLFSHFTIDTLTGALPDPAHPDERQYLGPELVAFLHRWPNVIGWINGHTHTNEVQAVPDRSGRTGGFWQITTASHVDFPEHARIVEVVDNRDGTLSLVCTMLDHVAPVQADVGATSSFDLAAWSRELAANDVDVNIAHHLGDPSSLNVELVLRAPFDLASAGIDGSTSRAASTRDSEDGGPSPTTIAAGATVAVAAAAVGGAIALRRRRRHDADPSVGETEAAPDDADADVAD